MAVILSNIDHNRTAETYSVYHGPKCRETNFEKSNHIRHCTRQEWRLRSLGILRIVGWQFRSDVSGQPIGPLSKGQAVQEEEEEKQEEQEENGEENREDGEGGEEGGGEEEEMETEEEKEEKEEKEEEEEEEEKENEEEEKEKKKKIVPFKPLPGSDFLYAI